MEQLTVATSKKQLSSIFDSRFKTFKLFYSITQNKQLLISITMFLDIPDILRLSVGSKQLNKIIQNNPQIQNRVLRAQVSYLTKEQQKNIQSSPIYHSLNNSAYSLFQNYWENSSLHIDQRLKKMNNGQASLRDFFPFSLRAYMANFRKKNKQPKEILQQAYNQTKKKHQNNQINKNQLSLAQQLAKQQAEEKQIIESDREYQLLTKWEIQVGQKKLQQKIKKYAAMSKQERREVVLRNLRSKNIPYEEVLPADSSLIVAQVTFWDRLKSQFISKNSN